mgnify:CR=1 FL=1
MDLDCKDLITMRFKPSKHRFNLLDISMLLFKLQIQICKNVAHQLSWTSIHDDRKDISYPSYTIDQCQCNNIVFTKCGSRVIEKVEHG